MTVQRAAILFDQKRYDLAADEARRALSANPNDAKAHAVLSLSLTGQEWFEEAITEAQAAIAAAPDLSLGFVALGEALVRRNRFGEARQAVRQAILLNPSDADTYALLARIELASRDWKAAYEATTRGLAIVANHAELLRVRSLAATHLGRPNEGYGLALTSLREAPKPSGLATLGYQQMQAGQFKLARETFTNALKQDPRNRLARNGLLETIKATNVFYRWILRYFLFMSRLSTLQRVAILFGAPFVYRLVVMGIVSLPAVTWLLVPLVSVWVAFVLSSWLAVPLSNLALMLHPFGRHVLNEQEKDRATFVGALLAASLVGVALLVGGIQGGLFLAVSGVAAAIPTSTAFRAERGWPRWVLGAFAAAAVVTGGAATVVAFMQPNPMADSSPAWTPFWICLAIAIASMWASQALLRVQPAR